MRCQCNAAPRPHYTHAEDAPMIDMLNGDVYFTGRR